MKKTWTLTLNKLYAYKEIRMGQRAVKNLDTISTKRITKKEDEFIMLN